MRQTIYLALLATLSSIATAQVSNLLPVFPNNLVVFPDRDFLTVEGFTQYTNQEALVQVFRNGRITGAAVGTISGVPDLAFEINHPGAPCWGTPGLEVTPDLKPGDRVSISIGGIEMADTIIQDAYITSVNYEEGTNANNFTITGYIGPDVNQANIEQRIVNPDLKDTEVGRRDVRAIPGPLVANTGYSSSMTIEGTTFTVLYVFDSVETARIAAHGAAQLTTWQFTDIDGNAQGLTIAEFGEHNGPQMGGCPLGPADVDAPVSTYAVVYADDKRSAQVFWNEAVALPQALSVAGYDVQFMYIDTEGVNRTIGARIKENIRQVTIDGLNPDVNYTVEVRSITSSQRMSFPFTTKIITTPPVEPPTLELSPAVTGDVTETTEVTIASNTGIIYFTVGDVPVINADGQPSAQATLYTTPIAITKLTALNIAAFAGNGLVTQATATFAPPHLNTKPSIPTEFQAAGGAAQVTLTWGAPVETDIVAYRISQYDYQSRQLIGTTETVGDQTLRLTMTIGNLAGNTWYTYSIASKNTAGTYSDESNKVDVLTTAPVDRIVIETARSDRGDFRMSGTGSIDGAIIKVYRVDATQPDGVGAEIAGSQATVTGGAWSVRVRPLTNVPTRVYVKSNKGGLAGPFDVNIRRK